MVPSTGVKGAPARYWAKAPSSPYLPTSLKFQLKAYIVTGGSGMHGSGGQVGAQAAEEGALPEYFGS
jgi:hypothetical protein